MDILYLSHKNPVREDEGAKMVIMGTLEHLAKKGCRITLVYLDQDNGDGARLDSICSEVIRVPHRPRGRLAGMAESFLSGTPYTVRMFSNPDFRKAVLSAVARKRFGLVHMETALLYQYIDCVKGLPVLIRHHNLEADLLAQRAKAAESPLKRFALARQAKMLAAYEAEAINSTEMSVTITGVDRARILEAYGCKVPVNVIPSGINAPKEPPVCRTEHCLVFSGRIEWAPNAEGIEWFVKEVFPRLGKDFPGLKLYIVGGTPPKKIRELGGEKIKVTGFVESVAEYIDLAEVYIVPLLSGSGMRLKILEAMSRGKAIVSTSKGAEGISCRSGRDIMIADGPEAFAEAVRNLLSDRARNGRMGREACRTVKENYSWESVADMFLSSYSQMLSGARKTGARHLAAVRR